MKKKNSLRNILIWFILGLFAFSGLLQGTFFGANNQVVAYVGKQTIKISDVQKYMHLIKVPANVNREDEQVKGYIFRRALELIVKRSLITQECKRLKLVVSDEKVAEYIRNQPQFFIDGKFSRSMFLSELSKLGFSEMEYKSIQKENLLQQQWFYILKMSYVLPEHVVNTVARSGVQKRSGRYSEVLHKSINVPKLNSAQLTKYYKDNISLFREDVRKTYKVLEFDDKKIVQKVNFAINKQNFDKVIKDYGLKVFDLDSSSVSELQNIADSLNLKINENSQLYIINGKYYALKLVDLKESYTPPLSEIKEKVQKHYVKQYIQKHIKPKNWVMLKEIKLGEAYLGVPEQVLQALFLNAPGKLKRYDKDDKTYFIVVDNIIQSNVLSSELTSVVNYLDNSILNDVIFAAIESLKLRYKIVILI